LVDKYNKEALTRAKNKKWSRPQTAIKSKLPPLPIANQGELLKDLSFDGKDVE
jgi:hypothetical protein